MKIFWGLRRLQRDLQFFNVNLYYWANLVKYFVMEAGLAKIFWLCAGTGDIFCHITNIRTPPHWYFLREPVNVMFIYHFVTQLLTILLQSYTYYNMNDAVLPDYISHSDIYYYTYIPRISISSLICCNMSRTCLLIIEYVETSIWKCILYAIG